MVWHALGIESISKISWRNVRDFWEKFFIKIV
jgi:hypothetical protein